MSSWYSFDCDLELSVSENGEVYALVFPCRRTQAGGVDAKTGRPVFVDPTHWRVWRQVAAERNSHPPDVSTGS
jgi:hypothetical protein